MLLQLQPAFKDYLWGGTRLKTDFGFQTDLDPVAEGWMLSCHKDGQNTVKNGKHKGKTLSQVIAEEGKGLLGTHCADRTEFPILIKLIDAKQNLSVQVHPDDAYARRVEGEPGKTECWYILDCDEGAELIYGFKQKISKAEFRERIENNTFLEVVNHVKVHKGDFFFIEAGTLHAIGGGILLAEIQQNSNTTYRVYDYGRLGADGKPRPLHTEKALDVTVTAPPARASKPEGHIVHKDGYTEQLLTTCSLFTVHAVKVESAYQSVADKTSFVSVLITEGNGEISCSGETLALKKGDSIFLAANSGSFQIKGSLSCVETRI